MKREHYPADVVNLREEDSYCKITNSLFDNGACFIIGLDCSMVSAFETLITLTGEFFDQTDAMDTSPYVETYEHANAKGYFSEDKYFNCLSGKRFLTQVDEDGKKVNNKNMPHEKMLDASKTFVKKGLEIAKGIMASIEKTEKLKNEALQKLMGYRTTIALTRSVQLTQTRLKKMFEDKKLIIEENTNNVVLFPLHADFPPLTFLMYKDGNIKGLEGLWGSGLDSHFLPMQPPKTIDPYLLVTVGKQMHACITGLKPFVHRVITDPETQKQAHKAPRFSAGLFFEIKDTPLKKLSMKNNPLRKLKTVKSSTDLAVTNFEKLDESIEERAEKNFPKDTIDQYPSLSL